MSDFSGLEPIEAPTVCPDCGNAYDGYHSIMKCMEEIIRQRDNAYRYIRTQQRRQVIVPYEVQVRMMYEQHVIGKELLTSAEQKVVARFWEARSARAKQRNDEREQLFEKDRQRERQWEKHDE
jgi:hypothetical protein